MITLGVETSTQHGSLALFNKRNLIDTKSWSRTGSHSEFLSTSLSLLLKEHSLKVQDFGRLAVGVGPGSFTGIRVGINFVRALAYSLQIPVYTLNSLHVLAAKLNSSEGLPIRVIQYAFRNLVYTSTYKLDFGLAVETSPPKAHSISECLSLITERTLLLGSGVNHLVTAASDSQLANLIKNPALSDDPSAASFLNTPALDQSPINLTDWIHTIPLYIRASEAEEKLKTHII